MSNDIDLRIVEYNKKVNLLNHEISVLAKDVKNLDKVVQSRIAVSSSLVKKRDKTASIAEKIEITDQISNMKLETNKSFQQIKKNEAERDRNLIQVEGDLKLISHLESQKKVYDRYCIIFLIVGSLLGVFGFIGWVVITYYTVDKDYEEYKERKRNRQTASTPSTPQMAQPNTTPVPLNASTPSSTNNPPAAGTGGTP
ncbi:MAG: hypothetical protein EOO45_02715 [Flavobacterium sp.]|nr:MAG: hypothetical protein EOO45_02715 [Flavobacterium sp.]